MIHWTRNLKHMESKVSVSAYISIYIDTSPQTKVYLLGPEN